jgi:hypothetical protein
MAESRSADSHELPQHREILAGRHIQSAFCQADNPQKEVQITRMPKRVAFCALKLS